MLSNIIFILTLSFFTIFGTKMLKMLTEKQHHIIINILNPFGPNRIGIFGSFARNEEQRDSDLDILVNFSKPINLLDIIGLEQELAEKLGIKVDLVTERSVHPKIKKYINNDLKVILE
jgi:predicted nucleotidyltransferase